MKSERSQPLAPTWRHGQGVPASYLKQCADCGTLFVATHDCSGRRYVPPPLSRRDQFAMAAMQGLLAASDVLRFEGRPIVEFPLVKAAVELADALIAELDRDAR